MVKGSWEDEEVGCPFVEDDAAGITTGMTVVGIFMSHVRDFFILHSA